MDKEAFATRLAELRMNKGVSAREMSLSLGLNHGYIATIENGLSYPTMENFLYICDYLDVTPQEFFSLDMPNPQKAEKLYQEIRSLSNSELDAVMNVIKVMKGNRKKVQ